MAPRIVLATVGSLGDLHPFIAIAQRLQTLGADPIIAAAPDYAARVGAAGIPFHGMRPGLASVQRDLGQRRATGATRRRAHAQAQGVSRAASRTRSENSLRTRSTLSGREQRVIRWHMKMAHNVRRSC